MIFMTPSQLVSTIRRFPIYMIGGILLMLADELLLGFGIFTGFMAVWTAACAITFDKWHSRPELWRQASVFLFFGVMAYIAALTSQITGIVKPEGNGILIAIDIAIATTLAGQYFRFLLTIIRVNRYISLFAPRAHTPG
ncbi:MAG: hypothetical protein CMJ78_15270 [Planctomycetaceae bacterium]|nr:hypothetical protein [Planctomycetaceae bacterium]